MTQTIKNQKNPPPERGGRPGQRKQERLERQTRRQRRFRLILSGVVAAIILIAALTYVLIAARQSEDHALQDNVNATATANEVVIQATQTSVAAAAQATATVQQLIKENPTGPATPPAVSITPTKLADGLQYIVVKPGNGATVSSTSIVSVEYTGWVQSTGKKFDSSYDHGGSTFPVSLGLSQVIKGWDEGLVGMKIGETRRLIIPPTLGYGANDEKDQSGKIVIPKNSTLIFDVTAVGFGDAAAATATAAASAASGAQN
ncbi:FKBP-type peptidyl-prolyl cis-trans isomerase [Dictyobacter arantiisoli]|uniref:Peptidyl-prolyl cis-trans isomerase n=1 Tax=Dictyobacter arantiisoli TaxID=2014874 RepID=A0A5A5T7N1_9CHLR|nr:FKBP-type peptidyl-prolyl cis-trans isomerase [Dictyobacter arantiisoli]GCF07398.1 hypothetical protein KDI_09620 [Dictyobacter arantiisoli]